MTSRTQQRRWILLRGLARESKHWGDFPAQFQATFPEDKVILVDLPGTGERKEESSPLTIDGIMRSVRRQVHKNYGNGSYSLFAVSLGGMVSLSWMDHFPKEVEQSVIINSSSRLSPFYQRLRWESWKPFFASLTSLDVKAREEGILNLISNSEKNREALAPLWIRLGRQHTVSAKTVLVQLSAAGRYVVPTRNLGEKALFIVGMGDRLVEPECSEELAEHFQSPLMRHPWAGHDIPIDDPEWLLKKVAAWVNTKHQESVEMPSRTV